MNVKKFAQDKAKKIKEEKYLKENKENLYSVDDSKFKQFSVDLHKLSMDQDFPRRNLTKQDISIFLENQSQNKTFHNEKNFLEVQLKKFIKKLDENDGTIKDFIDSELEDGEDVRAEEIKKLIGVLSKKLSTESGRSSLKSNKISKKSNRESQYSTSKLLSEEAITPYLRKQINEMQEKLRYLQQQNRQYQQFKGIEKSQKQYIRHTLETVYKRQLEQVNQLEQLANIF